MRIYVAGPISGHDLQERADTFRAATNKLNALGAEAINPFDLHTVGISWEEAMKADIASLVTCGAIYLLAGWENSRGARIELGIARNLGLVVILEEENGESKVQFPARENEGDPR